ncbi:serine aminopeptidase domain-containing protein [Allokutzneria sp. NRRL B-24872]|uniref:serine aminopeptidase domain-containing protein n=1 Tax=Allokutzneria sp. NRRL B-24872 TaxID=1137961 RepID=UPI000A3C4EBB|nr:alpha/beta hydrolase [Allokutzneria sp. NRRL B-24872]
MALTRSAPGPRAVLLPGAGSDDEFVRAVFEQPLRSLGIPLITPGPGMPGDLVSALAEAAEAGPVLAGGISLGAHLAAAWAAENPDRCAGLLLAMPAWTGRSEERPAAVAARFGAASVREVGLPEALDRACAGVDPWLADELRRSWSRHGDALPDALDAAAATPAPTLADLSTITVPTGVAACSDDPLHPLSVAEAWHQALPTSALTAIPLRALGADRESLGRAAVLAHLRASSRH